MNEEELERQMYIDFMGKVAKIVQKDNGRLEFLSSPEIAEAYHQMQLEKEMLDEPTTEGSDNLFTRAMEESFKEIYENYKRGIKELAVNLIGLEYRFNEWRIQDRNNNHTMMGKWLSEAVTEQLKQDLADISTISLTSDEKKKITTDVRRNVKDRFEYQYREAFNDHFSALVRQQAAEDAKKHFDKLLKSDTPDAKKLLSDMILNLKRERNRY